LRALVLRGARRPPLWQPLAFYLGLASAAIALLGPLDLYNDELLTMHMLQHLVLVQVTAPLLLLGRPVQVVLRGLPPQRVGDVTRAVLRPKWVRAALTALTAPLVVTMLHNGALVFWHFPRFYEASLYDDLVHELQHLSFFGTALLFWWPIIEPVPRHHKLPTLWAIAAVFATLVVSMSIGAIITLADRPIYPFYASVSMPWGLNALTDQQIAGLAMWVGGGFLYMGAIVALLAGWLREEERRQALLVDRRAGAGQAL
jgi:cytochrome c oxidase assembly factor CtaG